MLLITLLGCDPESVEGPFALAYDGGEDCVEVDLAGVAAPEVFTVEAWVRGDPASTGAPRPFLEWKGLFTLGDPAGGGETSFAVGDTAGASTVSSVMDGVLHHVAGTWDGEKASLWVDGELQAFADGAVGSSAATLRVGCSAAADSYEGLLDEIRISGVVRYDEAFDRPVVAYEDDDDTIALFHFDEGTGTEAYDEPRGLVAGVYGPDWISFQLGAE